MSEKFRLWTSGNYFPSKFVFRELLKRGRSIVIANVDAPALASVAEEVLRRQGTEDIEDARKFILPAA